MSELGSSYVRIRPDTAGFKEDVDKAVGPATTARDLSIRPSVSQERLTAVREQLAALTDRARDVKIGVNDTEARAKILAIRARLADVSAAVVRPEVNVRGVAHAEADLAALQLQLNRLGQTDATPKIDVNKTDQATRSIGLLGTAIAAAIPLTVPLSAVLATGLATVGSAAVSAAAGLGAFGLVAKTILTDVSGASKALEAYDKATAKIQATEQYAIDHAKTHAQVLSAQATAARQTAAAQQTLTQATADFSPAQVNAARALLSFQDAWRSFAARFDPLVFRIMGEGLGIAQAHLGLLTPLVQGAGSALLQLEDGVKRAFGSPYWQAFITMIQRDAGPVLRGVVTVLGNLATGFAGVLMAFEPMSRSLGQGLVDLTAKFAAWGSTLGGTSGFQHFMDYVRTEGPILGRTLFNIGQALVEIAPVLARIGHVELTGLSLFSRLIADIAGVINSLPGPVQNFAIALGAVALAYSRISPLVSGLTELLLGRRTATVLANEAIAKSYRDVAVAAGEAAAAEGAAAGGGVGGILGKIGAGRAGGILGAIRGAAGGITDIGAVGGAGAIIGGGIAAGAGLAAITAPAAAARIDAARSAGIDAASTLGGSGDITAIQNAQANLAALNATMAAYLHYKATGKGPPIEIPPDFRVRLGEARTEVQHLATNTSLANVSTELFASDLRKLGVAANDTAGGERNHAQSVAAVRSAVTDAASALRSHVTTLIATGTSTSAANRIAQSWAAQLEVQAAKTLGSKAAADKLLGSLHLLPRQIQTDVTLGGVSVAERQIDALMTKIAGIPRTVATTIVLHPDTSLADQALIRYQTGLAQPPHHAVGGFAPFGSSDIVGEQGPELRIETPLGAMYYPTGSAQTQSALSGRSGGSTYIVNQSNGVNDQQIANATMLALRRLELVHG